jgi:integrase
MPRRKAVDDPSRRGEYLGRVLKEDGSYHYLGYFSSKKARRAAHERAKVERPWIAGARGPDLTCREFADDWIARQYSGAIKTNQGRPIKRSTIRQREQALKPFLADFGDRTLTSITRREARRWTEGDVPTNAVLVAVTLFNAAVAEYDPTADEGLPSVNPFRGLGERVNGNEDRDPPTEAEFNALMTACDVLGDYANQERALLVFASHTLMRPGELCALDWEDVDFENEVVHVTKRIYDGEYDLPKSNEERTIALVKPAREALFSLIDEEQVLCGPVFRGKAGGRLDWNTHASYWRDVTREAGVDVSFYRATKHHGYEAMRQRGLSKEARMAQTGWSEAAVDKLDRVYGARKATRNAAHLAEVRGLYEDNVIPLRGAA